MTTHWATREAVGGHTGAGPASGGFAGLLRLLIPLLTRGMSPLLATASSLGACGLLPIRALVFVHDLPLLRLGGHHSESCMCRRPRRSLLSGHTYSKASARVCNRYRATPRLRIQAAASVRRLAHRPAWASLGWRPFCCYFSSCYNIFC